jgi:type IV pilus assembly protein PilB
LDHYYPTEENSLDDLLGEVGLDNFEGLDETKENELSDAANETPIIRFVNLVMQQAIRAQASDIHFEPFENEFRIRYRWMEPFMKCPLLLKAGTPCYFPD